MEVEFQNQDFGTLSWKLPEDLAARLRSAGRGETSLKLLYKPILREMARVLAMMVMLDERWAVPVRRRLAGCLDGVAREAARQLDQ